MHADSKAVVERVGSVYQASLEIYAGYPQNGSLISQRVTASGSGDSVYKAVMAACKEARQRLADDDQMSPERRAAFLVEVERTEGNALGANQAAREAERD